MTVDPLWPAQRPYFYVDSNPSDRVDHFGFAAIPRRFGCGNPTNEYIYRFCNSCWGKILCQLECDRVAYAYYRRCKGIPGPGRFAPPAGGGVVAPRRDLGPDNRNQAIGTVLVDLDRQPRQNPIGPVITCLPPGQNFNDGNDCLAYARDKSLERFPGSNWTTDFPMLVGKYCRNCCKGSVNYDSCIASCNRYEHLSLLNHLNQFSGRSRR